MAECRLPRGVVFWANAVDHDCRNEARRYCRRAENGVALATKHPRVHRNSPDRSSDLTRQPLRTPIANLCLSPAPTDAPKHSAFSVPNRHQTNHHPARPSIGAGPNSHYSLESARRRYATGSRDDAVPKDPHGRCSKLQLLTHVLLRKPWPGSKALANNKRLERAAKAGLPGHAATSHPNQLRTAGC